ncbi:MAG TPA: phosphoribosyltransferase family protein, partial [Nitrosospira sp.]
MIFENRAAAAKQLAAALPQYRNKNPLVLAIPRGAVPMAKIIADELNGEFDV